MLDHFNRHRIKRRAGGCRSRLEEKVGHDLDQLSLDHSYEPDRFTYTLTRKYTPDFKVGGEHPFFIEVKGWWEQTDRMKFLAVIISNPDLRIFVALQKPFQTISKSSRTTYADWCTKNGIAWCPIPIPKDFLEQWVSGLRPSCHAPAATAVMQQQSIKTDGQPASPAVKGSRRRAA